MKPSAENLPPAIFLMGPTTSGKSQIAIEIADRFPVEIISVDSAQVYRHMNIGTAKPSDAILQQTPHHLIDLINPDQAYSAAQFCTDALSMMQTISSRNHIPLLVGGTMLYFQALKQGLAVLPAADHQLRKTFEQQALESGWPALHQHLAELDPQTASRIQPTDSQRIQRALEIFYLTQKPMSEILQSEQSFSLPYRTINLALIPSDRSQLHVRIAKRFEQMLGSGLIDEVASIRQKFPQSSSSPSMRCVGYRQTCQYLDREIDSIELHDSGIAATRQLAKRQLTWLRNIKWSDSHVFDCLENQLATNVCRFLHDTMKS